MNLYEFCRHQENMSDVAKTSYPEYTVFSVTEDKDFQGGRKIGSQMLKCIKLKCMVDKKKAMSTILQCGLKENMWHTCGTLPLKDFKLGTNTGRRNVAHAHYLLDQLSRRPIMLSDETLKNCSLGLLHGAVLSPRLDKWTFGQVKWAPLDLVCTVLGIDFKMTRSDR